MDEPISLEHWPPAGLLRSSRLLLEPLSAEHATELAPLFDDPRLHEFTGGSPASAADLRVRFEIKARGHSADRSERWLNWVLRVRESDLLVGLVQATVTAGPNRTDAAVAWVTATAFQGQGYAKEAAAALVAWLRSLGPVRVVAYIHPDHLASSAVASSVGLQPTAERADGEVVWVRDPKQSG